MIIGIKNKVNEITYFIYFLWNFCAHFGEKKEEGLKSTNSLYLLLHTQPGKNIILNDWKSWNFTKTNLTNQSNYLIIIFSLIFIVWNFIENEEFGRNLSNISRIWFVTACTITFLCISFIIFKI